MLSLANYLFGHFDNARFSRPTRCDLRRTARDQSLLALSKFWPITCLSTLTTLAFRDPRGATCAALRVTNRCSHCLSFGQLLDQNFAATYNVDTRSCDSLYTAACEVVDNCTLFSVICYLLNACCALTKAEAVACYAVSAT